ncbi:MAG: cation:proton antiporter [Candidatus Peribacteria bacterium]|nr:MAG: cation:proton antiporter [Candidatus Peribacteria bacterium]
MHLAGWEVPLSVMLLFGIIISSTDPVAVLSIFKHFGVPKRLYLIFEGESLFNDATSVSGFLILIGILSSTQAIGNPLPQALLSFIVMI